MSFVPENFTVWAEIPVTDLPRAQEFYEKVFDLELKIEDAGPNPVVMFPTKDGKGVAGHLYPGKPATEGQGPTVHFLVPDSVEATLERVSGAGGKVLSQIITIPSGHFAYCQDPDGNSIGVFAFTQGS